MIESAFLNYGTGTPMSINMPMQLDLSWLIGISKTIYHWFRGVIAIIDDQQPFFLFNIFLYLND